MVTPDPTATAPVGTQVPGGILLTQEQLQKAAAGYNGVSQSIGQTSEAVSQLTGNLASANPTIEAARLALNGVKGSVDLFSQSTQFATAEQSQFNLQIDVAAHALAVLGVNTLGISDSFNKFADTTNLGSQSLTTYSSNIKTISSAIDKLLVKDAKGNPIGELAKTIAGFGKDVVIQMVQAKFATDQYKTSLYSLYAQHGQLNSISGEGININDALSAKMAGATVKFEQLGNIMGFTLGEVEGVYREMMKLSLDGFDKFTVASDGPYQGMTRLQAAMLAASGTTGQSKDALEFLGKELKEFGDKTTKPIDDFTKLFQVSKELEVPFEVMREAVMTSSDSFKYFGNNISGTTAILGTFIEGLKKTGIGYAQATEIGKGYLSQIGQLDFAQKAFLSSQTGGPGGIQGALQIEEMLAKGDIAQVVKKVQQSLRQQFGSNIVTREQGAARGGSDANQYLKEVQLLTSGPLGKLISNPAMAAKFLELMQSGGDTAATKFLSDAFGKMATTESVKRGDDRADDRANPFLEGFNRVERIERLSTQESGDTMGSIFGRGNATTTGRRKELSDTELRSEDMNKATESWIRSGKVMENLNRLLVGTIKDGAGTTQTAFKVLGEGATKMTKALTDAVDRIKEIQEKKLQEATKAGADLKLIDTKIRPGGHVSGNVLLPINIYIDDKKISIEAKPGDTKHTKNATGIPTR